MKYLFPYFVLLGLLYSCKQTSTVRKNEQLYKQNNIDIEVNYLVCHENDSVSRLYYSINNSELTYKKIEEDSFYTAELHLFYKIKEDVNAKQFVDTATVVIKDRQRNVLKGFITGSKQLSIGDGRKLFVELELRDINRKAYNNSQLFINKESKTNAQNYLVKSADSNLIYVSYITKPGMYAFKNMRAGGQEAFVHYAAIEQKLPPPPFSKKDLATEPLNYDSVYAVNRNSNGWFGLTVEKQGLYFLSTDSLSNSGCSLFSFEESFPKVTSHQQMIESIRYITKKDEYESLLESQDKQQAIESFWIGIGGNKDRARSLIRKYYGRVQDANIKFSSDREGWRTDRGMIFIVMGPPEYVYQSEGEEVWVYGSSLSAELRFNFKRINSPVTNNAFELERHEVYRDPWYMAVTAWREGRIFLDN